MRLGTPDVSTLDSRLEYLNRPQEWHEEHRRQVKRDLQVTEFHRWATAWSNGVQAARKRTAEGIEFVYNALMEAEDNADLRDTQESARW